MCDSRRVADREAIFRRHLATLRPGRLLDLATGHGKFAVIARNLGWEVTAMDVRDVRFPSVPGIRWVVGDVRTFDVSGYDVISNLGLLYHLELDDVISLIERCAPTPMILDTHVSLRANRRERGYKGHLFREVSSDDPEEMASTATAAWGNLVSFWPTEKALLRMLRRGGYSDVYRLSPRYEADRTFYWCV